jgi:hypothetical protein
LHLLLAIAATNKHEKETAMKNPKGKIQYGKMIPSF